MEMIPITIAGCGPGSVQFLTVAALNAIHEAEVLVGARRLLALFPQTRAQTLEVGVDIAKALDAIALLAGKKRVVVLVTGDPGLCSLARPVIRRFGLAACQVLPGVSSVQAAFARLGEDWLGVRVLSAHDAVPAVAPASLVHEEKIALLAGGPTTAAWVANLAQTLAASHTLYLCENLTLENESVRAVDPTSLPMLVPSRSILIFLKNETPCP
jgi:cobalt-precorrin-7 (C5)-methyltransferase